MFQCYYYIIQSFSNKAYFMQSISSLSSFVSIFHKTCLKYRSFQFCNVCPVCCQSHSSISWGLKWNKAYVLHLSVCCCFTFQVLLSLSNKNRTISTQKHIHMLWIHLADITLIIFLFYNAKISLRPLYVSFFWSYLSFSPSFFVSSSFCSTSCDIMVSFCVSMLSWIFWSTTKALWLSNSNFCCSLSCPAQTNTRSETQTLIHTENAVVLALCCFCGTCHVRESSMSLGQVTT